MLESGPCTDSFAILRISVSCAPLIVDTYNTHLVDLRVFPESTAGLNFRTQHGELISMFYNILMVSTEEVYCLTSLMVQSVFVTVDFTTYIFDELIKAGYFFQGMLVNFHWTRSH